MPNTPGTLRLPPPGPEDPPVTADTFLATLPSPKATGALLALLSVVSYEAGERVSGGRPHRTPMTPKGPHRKPRDPIEPDGSPWECLDPIEPNGSPWECLGPIEPL